MKSSKMFRGYGFIENGIYPDDFFSYPELLYIDNFSHMASVGLSGDIYENEVNYKYNDSSWYLPTNRILNGAFAPVLTDAVRSMFVISSTACPRSFPLK